MNIATETESIVKIGDYFSVDNKPPYFQVLIRDGDWVTIRRFKDDKLTGRVMRRKVVTSTRHGERIRLPVTRESKFYIF